MVEAATREAASRTNPAAGEAPEGGTKKNQPRIFAAPAAPKGYSRHPRLHRSVRTARHRSSCNLAVRGNLAVGLINGINAVARAVGSSIAHALERYLGPRLSRFEIARRQREAEDRHAAMDAKAAAAERADREREFQQELEEQRRRLEDELEAIRHRARQRSHAAQLAGLSRTFAALARRAPKPPAPKKSARRRRGEDGQGHASYRKNIKRLFDKVTRWTIGDERGDDPPSIDAEAEHRHQQRMASPDQEHGRGARHYRPNYPSPTL
jgi:hypothetical protein